MNGASHRITGVTTWALAAPPLGVTHPWQLLAGGIIAGACAHGRLSPDADSGCYPWLSRLADRHRGVLHWFAWPLLGLLWAMPRSGPYRWQIAAVVVAWTSHIAGDLVFGKPGVPILPRLHRGRIRWVYVGLQLDQDSLLEKWLPRAAAAGVGVWLALPT